ncbi:hypothetical protein [Vannielia litorea]|uniref:Uncharacterized protein n=1 Tax=Vannielia litorea TaxID=1217970 RepID=A0A1N6IGU5_9RHOB|nr:hypothetical protein [Vannielia litorea]SIO31221.1 hypothetical protein SAMN05444002_3873 [Vannielia litorea]
MTGPAVHEATARLLARSHALVEALLLEGSNPWELGEALEAAAWLKAPAPCRTGSAST